MLVGLRRLPNSAKVVVVPWKRPLKMVYKQCVWLTVWLVSLPACEIVLEPCRGRGLKLLERLICILQVVRGCIGPILSLPIMGCLFSAVLMCWRSICRVFVLVRLRLSRIDIVTGGVRHPIHLRLSFFVRCCEWLAWGCDL